MDRTEVMHWLLNLQTDVEYAIKKIEITEREYNYDEVDEILVDELPEYMSDIEEDISQIKENMQ